MYTLSTLAACSEAAPETVCSFSQVSIAPNNTLDTFLQQRYSAIAPGLCVLTAAALQKCEDPHDNNAYVWGSHPPKKTYPDKCYDKHGECKPSGGPARSLLTGDEPAYKCFYKPDDCALLAQLAEPYAFAYL